MEVRTPLADEKPLEGMSPPEAKKPLEGVPRQQESPPKPLEDEKQCDHGIVAYTSFEDFPDNLQLYGVPWSESGSPIRNLLEPSPLCHVRQAFFRGRRNFDDYFAVIVGLQQRADLNGHLAWIAAADLRDQRGALVGSLRVGAVPILLSEFGAMVQRRSSGGSRRHLLGSAGIRVRLANLRFVVDIDWLLRHIDYYDPI